MSLNANALVTLAQGKSHLDIKVADTTQDTRVELFINAVSDYIEHVTLRRLKTQSYTHRFTADGTPYLLLREYPVTAVASVYDDATWVFAGPSLVAATDYDIFKDAMLIRKSPSLWDASKSMALRVAYTAGFTVVPWDLQLAALVLLEIAFDSRDQRTTRLQSRSKLGDTVSFVDKVPEHISAMIAPHVREEYVKRQRAMA